MLRWAPAALLGFLLWAAASGQARAECVGGVASHLDQRAVAPVFINGDGPFSFIVDTGANRSVLSQQLAQRLGVLSHGTGEVHTIDSVRAAPLGRVTSLNASDMWLANIDLPLLDGDVLAGHQGFLGVDGFAGRRVLLDFEHHCVEISNARGASALDGWISIAGRLQYGSSFVMDGRIGDVPIIILVDTGSTVSLANVALREALRVNHATTVQRYGDFLFTAGKPLVSTIAIWTPRIHIGASQITNVRAFVGDYHIFRLWGLTDTPTLLIGMDVLAQSRAMAIDYESRTIYFSRAPHGLWRDVGATNFAN